MRFRWDELDQESLAVFMARGISALFFWMAVPVGFIIGAVWSGIYVGFIAGRDA